MDPEHIVNWRRLTPQITTSGQPSEADLSQIQALGVTHVVNLGLHTHERALQDEGAIVAHLGMTYVHIPVEFDSPTESNYEAFCSALRSVKDEPVHVHCIVNARVTAFFYRYQRDVLGIDAAEARGTLESVWKPGGIWASFIGEEAAATLPHRYAGRDYDVRS
jgi:uncharacterized protein (TIGR01244 family)